MNEHVSTSYEKCRLDETNINKGKTKQCNKINQKLSKKLFLLKYL